MADVKETAAMMPAKPSRLSIWMEEHGRPSQLRVDCRATGADTADTWIVLMVVDFVTGKCQATIEVRPGEFGTERWDSAYDTLLKVDHAYCMDWTESGRKKLDAWKQFEKREARDLAEFARLKKKFSGNP